MRRHDTDFVSLVFGLIFVGIGAVTLLDAGGVVHLHLAVGWLLAGALVGLGSAGLAGALNRHQRTRRAREEADVTYE